MVKSLFLYFPDNLSPLLPPGSVRSFGTEDRQVPKPIPPRAETYEFIIFRGSDIKDLHVSEIPAKTEEAPQDPAIVSAVSIYLYMFSAAYYHIVMCTRKKCAIQQFV